MPERQESLKNSTTAQLRPMSLRLDWPGAKGVVAGATTELLSTRLGEERLGLGSDKADNGLVCDSLGVRWLESLQMRMTDLETCLLRRALILAVQGLMMLSEGET